MPKDPNHYIVDDTKPRVFVSLETNSGFFGNNMNLEIPEGGLPAKFQICGNIWEVNILSLAVMTPDELLDSWDRYFMTWATRKPVVDSIRIETAEHTYDFSGTHYSYAYIQPDPTKDKFKLFVWPTDAIDALGNKINKIFSL